MNRVLNWFSNDGFTEKIINITADFRLSRSFVFEIGCIFQPRRQNFGWILLWTYISNIWLCFRGLRSFSSNMYPGQHTNRVIVICLLMSLNSIIFKRILKSVKTYTFRIFKKVMQYGGVEKWYYFGRSCSNIQYKAGPYDNTASITFGSKVGALENPIQLPFQVWKVGNPCMFDFCLKQYSK